MLLFWLNKFSIEGSNCFSECKLCFIKSLYNKLDVCIKLCYWMERSSQCNSVQCTRASELRGSQSTDKWSIFSRLSSYTSFFIKGKIKPVTIISIINIQHALFIYISFKQWWSKGCMKNCKVRWIFCRYFLLDYSLFKICFN